MLNGPQSSEQLDSPASHMRFPQQLSCMVLLHDPDTHTSRVQLCKKKQHRSSEGKFVFMKDKWWLRNYTCYHHGSPYRLSRFVQVLFPGMQIDANKWISIMFPAKCVKEWAHEHTCEVWFDTWSQSCNMIIHVLCCSWSQQYAGISFKCVQCKQTSSRFRGTHMRHSPRILSPTRVSTVTS